MSSSKIQEYNLDPNMGLAKETSVQEVKTISDEIKSLISSEVASAKSAIIEEMSNIGGSEYCAGKVCTASDTLQYTFTLANSGYISSSDNEQPFIFYVPCPGFIKVKLLNQKGSSTSSNTLTVALKEYVQTVVDGTSDVSVSFSASASAGSTSFSTDSTTKYTRYILFNIPSAGFYGITFSNSSKISYVGSINVCYDLVDTYSIDMNI